MLARASASAPADAHDCSRGGAWRPSPGIVRSDNRPRLLHVATRRRIVSRSAYRLPMIRFPRWTISPETTTKGTALPQSMTLSVA